MILTRADLAWHLARESSKHSFPLGSIVIAIVPLLIPALLAYRNPPKTFLAAATRCWPVVAFGVYFLSGTGAAATPLHAFQGITFPLSVLAIEGLQTLPWRPFKRPRLVGALVVAVAAIPATGYELYNAAKLAAPTAGNGNFILAGERDALNYLAADLGPRRRDHAGLPRGPGAGDHRPQRAARRLSVVRAQLQRARQDRAGAVHRQARPAGRHPAAARDARAVRARRLQDHWQHGPRARTAPALGQAVRVRRGLRGADGL